MKPTFFLSTGRCGTHWLAEALTDVYGDLAVVKHETLREQFSAKRYYRQNVDVDLEVSGHFANLPDNYIEVGWPIFPVLPYAGECRVVNLIRHPVRTALSMATHNWYGGRRDWLGEFELTPDDNVLHGLDRWQTRTQYEKCLWLWTEVRLYADELRQKVEMMDIRFCDLINGHMLPNLVDFMGLPRRPELDSWRSRIVNGQVFFTKPVDADLIMGMPETMEMCRRYGYEDLAVDTDRYFGE